jgi:ABC-type lipopolysaccharide export system ATPase subunit
MQHRRRPDVEPHGRRAATELRELQKLPQHLPTGRSGGEGAALGLRRPHAHRRLEITRCLVTEPRIILLEEPFTGIDPVTIHSIQKIIKGLRDDGISILITDHRERETLAITDRSCVVRAGKVFCHGTAQEVLNNPDAKKYYFGESPGIEAA